VTILSKDFPVQILSRRGGWAEVYGTPAVGKPFRGWADQRLIRTQTVIATVVGEEATEEESESPRKRFAGTSKKVETSFGIEYLAHNYALSNRGSTPGDAFTYRLKGVGLRLQADYWFWSNTASRLRAGGGLSYELGLLRFGKFAVDTGTESLTVSSSNLTHNLHLAFPLEYRFAAKVPPSVRATAGFDYFRFQASDAKDSSGSPISLFVTSTMLSPTIGVSGTYVFQDSPQYEIGGGLDLLPISFVSESPAGATGASPTSSMGLIPSAFLKWNVSEDHRVSFAWSMRLQEVRFSGSGSRVAVGNINEGKAETTQHTFALKYDYALR
jgi:hypothetical protein